MLTLLRRIEYSLLRRPLAIVMYHAVSGTPGPYTTSPGAFRRQAEFLHRNYAIIRLREVPTFLLSDARTDQLRRVAITFDDAYCDFIEHPYPVLRRLGAPCTVFVPSGLIGGVNEWDLNKPNAVRRAIMNLEQLRCLAADDLVEIGSHSVDHSSMTRLTPEEMRVQATGSKDSLEALLGERVTSFAYPYGQLDDYSPLTTHVLREAGYQIAVTTRWGTRQSSEDLLSLRRISFLEEDDEWRLRAKIQGLHDWKAAKERLGYTYRRLRRAILQLAGRRRGEVPQS